MRFMEYMYLGFMLFIIFDANMKRIDIRMI